MFRRGSSTRIDRDTQLVERALEALERYEQVVAEQRIFIRDITRRNEKVVQDLVRHGNDAYAETAGDVATIMNELKELTKESRAQREGLLAAIDRLPPPQAP